MEGVGKAYMRTVEEVEYIYKLAKELMEKRDEEYQGSWREEGLSCAMASAFKKGSQMRTMYENGSWKTNLPKTKEDCLDGINYFIFCYRHIDLFEGGEG